MTLNGTLFFCHRRLSSPGFVDRVATGPCQVHSRSARVIYDPLFLRHIWVNYANGGPMRNTPPTYYSKNPPEYFYSSATTTVSEIRDQQHRLRTFDVLLSQGRVPREFYDNFDQGWSRNGSLDSPTMLHDACFKDSAAHLYLNIRCLF